MIRSISYSIGIVSLVISAQITSAESHPAIAIRNNRLNISNVYLTQVDGIDRNSGSQEFFRQGREDLDFLSDEEAESILEIDEDIEKQGDEENLVEESEGENREWEQDEVDREKY